MTDISTYMSLTLARLCDEWQLVSGNYKAQGASGGKYEAQIVIFRILAAVNRFSRNSWKSESCWGKLESRWGKSESRWRKSESRWRKRKAIEESRKLLKKIKFHVRKIGFEEKENPDFPKRFSSFWQFWGLVFWHQICYHVCAWIYFVELKYS